MKNKPLHWALVVLLELLLLPVYLFSQHIDSGLYSFDFNGVALSGALEDIANKTQADLIYDPDIIRGYSIYKRIQNMAVNEILATILRDTRLDYLILSSGTIVIVETVKKPPSYGSLSGKIVDANTGESLPGATVLLADASGGTVSNSTGHFNLNRLIAGTYQIIFSYVGYEPVKMNIEISPDRSEIERIPLRPRNVDFAPIIVTAHKSLLTNPNSTGEGTGILSDWETGSRSTSAIQSLTLFPGVQYGLPMTDLHLQGSQRSEHRMFLDGIPVYNPYSFGQIFSAFSPYSIGRVNVEKAGFDVTSGSLIAGKVSLSHDISNRNEEKVLVQIDPVNTNVKAVFDGTREDRDRFRLMTAFRSTFWNWYQDPVLSETIRNWDFVDPLTYNIFTNDENDDARFRSVRNESDIKYSDFHLASRFQADTYQSLYFSLYMGENAVNTDLLAMDDISPDHAYMFSRDSYEWDNLAAQISYDWLTSPRLDLQLQAAYSRNRLFHIYSMFNNDMIQSISHTETDSELFQTLAGNIESGGSQKDDNLISHFFTRADFNYAFSPSFNLGGGFQADRIYSRFNLTGFFYLPTLTSQESSLYSVYLNGHWMLPGNFQLTAGSRLTILSPSGALYPEPRAALQYDRTSSSIGYWSLRLAGGIYRQFINQFDITNVGPTSLVPDFTIWAHDSRIQQPKAYHASLSFLVEPTSSTSIKAESYMKLQPASYITSYRNLLTGREINRSGFDAFTEITNMYAYGGGIRLHQTILQSRIDFLLGYDLSISEINMDSQFGRVMPAPWNEPHRFQARVLGRIHNSFSVVANWQSILGRSWGFRQAYYDFMVPHNFTGAGQYDFLHPEGDRLKPFHQLDISFVYQRWIGVGNIETRLNLINVLNRKNTIDWNLHPVSANNHGRQEYEIRERQLPGFNPSVSFKISF